MATGMRVAALVGVLLLTAQACGPRTEAPASKTISAEQLAALISSGDAPFVLDVRTGAEYSEGHIPGAFNIPHSELEGRIDELPSDHAAEIVVHCQSGRRAQTAQSILTAAGFTDVLDLTGHMGGWREGGYPVE